LIIDVHYHFIPLPVDEKIAEEAIKLMAAGWLVHAERAGVKRTLDDVVPAYRDYLDDIECDKLVKRMDGSGIDVTAICVVDNAERGTDDEHIMRINQQCAQAATKHPGRLIALAGIDPRRPGAPALFRQCIEQFNMKGLKWHPDMGYYPNSPESYAVLAVANELSVPLLTHCGPLSNSRAKYAHPIHLDDIALDFPNIDIIGAHLGDTWWRDWATLARHKQNICGDLAMWQFMAESNPNLYRRYLREILDIVGPNQVLFASDGPVFEPITSNRDWVDMIKALATESADGIRFSDEEVKAILGGNAARVFKL